MEQKPTYEELERRVQELESDYSQLEKKLHESRLFSEEIMMYMTEGLVLTDTRGTVIFINQRLSEMLGLLPEEIIGKSWLDMVPAEQQASAQEAEARRAEGHTDRYEIILRHKDGYKFPVLIGAGPRFDKQSGGFIGTMGVVTDITERKKYEEAIRVSEQKYRGLIEGLDDTIYRMTIPDGIYEYFSTSVKEVFGYTSEEFIKNPFFIQRIIHSDFAGYFTEKWKELLEGKVQETYEYKIIDAKGNDRWIVQSNKAIFDDSGRIKAIEGLCRNVTERKQAEEVLNDERSFLSAVLDNIEEAVVTCDREGRILRFNKVLLGGQ